MERADKGCTGRGGCDGRARAAAGSAVILRVGGSADGFHEDIDALADGIRDGRDGWGGEGAGDEGEYRRFGPGAEHEAANKESLARLLAREPHPQCHSAPTPIGKYSLNYHARRCRRDSASLQACVNLRECKMQLRALRPAYHHDYHHLAPS
jgi:hypothetical protein